MAENVCAQCEKPAELKCSACKAVAYCSKEHQVQHWKSTHKNDCRAYEIETVQGMGKCLIARRDLQVGDIIISELPLVTGPRPHIVEEGPVPCPGCCRLILADEAPRCEGCDWPICHTECSGLKDPARHGWECFILQLRRHRALDGLHEYYRQDTLLAIRCLLIQRRGIKKWLQFLQMEAHMEKRGKDTEIYKYGIGMHTTVVIPRTKFEDEDKAKKEIDDKVVDYLEENFFRPLKLLEAEKDTPILPDVSRETLHQICGIIDVNSLEINQDAEVSAVYPTACLLEHNCVPNTTYNFGDESTNYKITVRAALPIKKGEHISTMYTHALWGTQARREHLKETKYFFCTCQRCTDKTELGTYLSALRCIGTELTQCGGTQLPINPLDDTTDWACDKCDVRISNVEASYLINQIGDDVDRVQLSNPTIRDLENLLSKLLTFLHPNHYHCFSIKHSLVQLYGYQQGYLPNQISDDQLIRKTKMCREMVDITKKIDPGNARLCLYTGVLLHELHLANIIYVKRKWDIGIKRDLLKLLKEANQSVIEAKDVLKYEATTQSGEKLHSLIDSSKQDFDKWIKRNKIDLNKEVE